MPVPFKLPASASVPAVTVLEPSASAAPLLTVTAGLLVSKSEAPSVRLPLTTLTVAAAAVPFRVEAPFEVSVPRPSAALAVPPFKL